MAEERDPDRLTHLSVDGTAHMVDVTGKAVTVREAEARGSVRMRPQTVALIREHGAEKGDVLGVARVAGIMAAKRTSELIPLCHSLPLSSVEIHFDLDEEEGATHIAARVRCEGKTGVEMEALTAVSVAALTIYDMCKAVERGMVIDRVRLTGKSGGRSGTFSAD